ADQSIPTRRQSNSWLVAMGLRPLALGAGRVAKDERRPGCGRFLGGGDPPPVGTVDSGWLDRSRRHSRATGRTNHTTGRPVALGTSPPVVWRLSQASGRGSLAGRRPGALGQYGPTLQRESRAAL